MASTSWAASVALVGVVAICSATPSKADITYNFNLAVGPGSVTDTITTDGNTGAVSWADIKFWDITISDGTESYTLVPGSIVVGNPPSYDSPSGLTATAGGLFFDFSSSNDQIIGFPSDPYLCFEDASGACSGVP